MEGIAWTVRGLAHGEGRQGLRLRSACVKWRPHNWKVDLGRALGGGLGSLLALTATGWPDAAEAGWVGFGGFVAGLVLALAVEYVVRLHGEVSRLREIEQQLATEQRMRKRERELRDYQVMIAKREAAVADIGTKVWGGAFNELAKKHPQDAQRLPVLMARQQAMLKARGLDKPAPPPPS
jgi:hypothetical protein